MKFFITDIKYDTDGQDIDLPTEMEMNVPAYLNSEDALDFISNKISDETGYCHFGFKTFPEII